MRTRLREDNAECGLNAERDKRTSAAFWRYLLVRRGRLLNQYSPLRAARLPGRAQREPQGYAGLTTRPRAPSLNSEFAWGPQALLLKQRSRRETWRGAAQPVNEMCNKMRERLDKTV